MTKISATIVADSKAPSGDRLTTMLVTFPRFILAEGKTHRIIKGALRQVEVFESIGLNDDENFSKNSASSRAIPFNKMVESVQNDPFIPIAWQKEHKGMQGTEYITDPKEIQREVEYWLEDRDYAILSAKRRTERGVTKQIVNRQLEPFMWHTVLISATEFSNFFELRCPNYEIDLDNLENLK